MQEVRLALIGFGNVAQGLVQILHQRGEQFARQYGIEFLITAITDRNRGSAFDPNGIPTASLLEAFQHPGGLRSLSNQAAEWDALEMIQHSPSDVVVEMSYTNLQDGEPATTYIAEALSRKKHVVTTNKGPIALRYEELASLAKMHGVQIGVEGTVMSGTPTLRVAREMLDGAGIRSIQGILNGTTNFILTQMECGKSYEEALAEAQRQGYAEADPTGDVEGYDAAAKVAILSRLALNAPVPYANIERRGISGLTAEDISSARAKGMRWKLIGSLEKKGDEVTATVRPELLPDEHPLASVSGATNAILYRTDLLGDVVIIGPGAGREQTGYAIIQDLFAIYNVRKG
ncbi:MAG: homoserine dehydrogenase [Chloroflexi bacterium]|nr:homoserine dehydrogenase [Chloroflexota bacterium]